MIAVDTNILVYAHREDSSFHKSAFRIIKQLAESQSAWAIPWPCIHEFLAIVTHPKIYKIPTKLELACEQVQAWLESPSLNLLSETEEHFASLKEIVIKAKIQGPKVHDARIYAICKQHGVKKLWSADKDFSRFVGLKVENPL